MKYTRNFKGRGYAFADLKTLLAKASPLRSADGLLYGDGDAVIVINPTTDSPKNGHINGSRVSTSDKDRVWLTTLALPAERAKWSTCGWTGPI